MEPLLTGVMIGPAGDRSGDPGRFTGIGLGLKTVQQGIATMGLALLIAHPGHVGGIALRGEGGLRRGSDRRSGGLGRG